MAGEVILFVETSCPETKALFAYNVILDIFLREFNLIAVKEEEEPIEIPINGELDLHTFRPAEVKDLLEDYFEACLEKGIKQVRVVHGKGTGTLRETVHACLRKSDQVADFALGDQTSGGWGATRVSLK
ncbi:Smr/MutS family protein [Puniceicoccaceae bacterium K14]|nr:Smr/MutS family protein [Puniceicoccaceae bacterium K14]